MFPISLKDYRQTYRQPYCWERLFMTNIEINDLNININTNTTTNPHPNINTNSNININSTIKTSININININIRDDILFHITLYNFFFLPWVELWFKYCASLIRPAPAREQYYCRFANNIVYGVGPVWTVT